MDRSWRSENGIGTERSERSESKPPTCLTLISDDANADYPTKEYTDGQIIYIFSAQEDELIVEYAPDDTADMPPLDVCNWALIIADEGGTVLASGIIRRAGECIGDICRYYLTPNQKGPAPPHTHPWM